MAVAGGKLIRGIQKNAHLFKWFHGGAEEPITPKGDDGNGGSNDLGGGVCGANSFSADTSVTTDHGEQAISTLKVGDHVLAYNQDLGTTGYYTVTAVIVTQDPQTEDLNIDGETVHTTPHHPFFTEDRGWIDAGALVVGEKIKKADGTAGTVEAAVLVPQPQRMYNLTVEGAHTFFVGQERWLVHNTFCGLTSDLLTNEAQEPAAQGLTKAGVIAVNLRHGHQGG